MEKMVTLSYSFEFQDSSYVFKLILIDQNVRINHIDIDGNLHDIVISPIDPPCENYLKDLPEHYRNDPRALWSAILSETLGKDMITFERFVCGSIVDLAGIICHRLFTGQSVPSDLKIVEGWSEGDEEIFQTWCTNETCLKITDQEVLFGDHKIDLQEMTLEQLL